MMTDDFDVEEMLEAPFAEKVCNASLPFFLLILHLFIIVEQKP